MCCPLTSAPLNDRILSTSCGRARYGGAEGARCELPKLSGKRTIARVPSGESPSLYGLGHRRGKPDFIRRFSQVEGQGSIWQDAFACPFSVLSGGQSTRSTSVDDSRSRRF